MMARFNLKVMDETSFDQSWALIGAGGSARIWKTKHLQLGYNVAIKELGLDNGLNRFEEYSKKEAEFMRAAEGPYIMRVMGIFKGVVPRIGKICVGLVMEMMERGSLASLQGKLKRLPPWPLVFRLAHQVALGMNDLHCLEPALIYKDLKPDNILLDTGLNVKITDFGLSKFVNNATAEHMKGSGTPPYMPPEALQGERETCAYDVYSYAMLLYSILHTGRRLPHPSGKRIPVFDNSRERPSLEYVKGMTASGLEELVDLMVMCWNPTPAQRPTFKECIAVTERLYEKHKNEIRDAVQKVQQELDGVILPDEETPSEMKMLRDKMAELVKKNAELQLDKDKNDLVQKQTRAGVERKNAGRTAVVHDAKRRARHSGGIKDAVHQVQQELNLNMEEKHFEENWTNLGNGGFGEVFKARHRQWRKDVAIKVLDDAPGLGKGLVPEAELMLRADSPYIMKILGVFRGRTPLGKWKDRSTSVGLVMDVMERGSLFSLQALKAKAWSLVMVTNQNQRTSGYGPALQKKRRFQLLPWPLVFRLADQVALGMKYLHSLTPAIIHKDLKPQNILLDSDLNMKITDFGIARFANAKTATGLKGVYSVFYAPPEAFTGLPGGVPCAYDVYSYAVLVWTILNPVHEDSFPIAQYGGRPSLEDVDRMKGPGLEELKKLMVTCWDENPKLRSTFAECTAVTGRLYEKHRRGIEDAVIQVQQELE